MTSFLSSLLFGFGGVIPPGSETPETRPDYPGEIPEDFVPATTDHDYARREVMIPMRDGVKLRTVIMIPNGARQAGILLSRTPYDARAKLAYRPSGHLGPMLEGFDNPVDVIVDGGYVRVVQDVRGKYGSEGDYIMAGPVRGPFNPTPVDDGTDIYDTIEWLVANVPESNGRVGVLGISYNGFEALMALVDPHPALKVAVPMNPMADGWMGDDWFHYGAFRQQMLKYVYEQTASRDNRFPWWTNYHDDYELFMHYGSAGALADAYGMQQLGFWKRILAHPAYDDFWRARAVDTVLAELPLRVPVMLVHGLWDQEDMYGAIAAYQALQPRDARGDMVKLVIGPWCHGQQIAEGSSLGAIRFGSDTARFFRREILRPYLAQYLKDGAPEADIAQVTAFQTGTCRWQRLSRWPSAPRREQTIQGRAVYLQAGHRLGFTAPIDATGHDEYVSDPARPVPYCARPIKPIGYASDQIWPKWLVDDQREASGRTDVLSYLGDVLESPLAIRGAPWVHLVAATSGTDCDWVVKLIDVYPAEVAEQPEMGGYQLAVAMDIFRGRYREGFADPMPIAANEPLAYRFALPVVNHVFLPGHRVMLQVQSSWFPLYDRNPQTFVPNILEARPDDYVQAIQSVYHEAGRASHVVLPVVAADGE